MTAAAKFDPSLELKGELWRRGKIIEHFTEDPVFRASEIRACKGDPSYFIGNWGWTYDPREETKERPFALWEFQNGWIDWLTEGYQLKKNSLTDKSRDMGVTWCAVGWTAWLWLFGKGITIRWGSRSADEVDDFTPDSVFGKIRYFLDRLPPLWVPPAFANKEFNQHMKLVHPENENVILGESMSPNFARSGRATVTFLDEFAHVQHSDAVWASVKSTCNVINLLSTPNGMDNMFAHLRHKTKIRRMSLHWRLDPRKDDVWYEAQKGETTATQLAQEIDISYEPIREGRIYTNYDPQFHRSKKVLHHNPHLEQFSAWDFGHGNAMALAMGQIYPNGFIEIWNYLQMSRQDIDFFMPLALGQRPSEYGILDREARELVDSFLGFMPRYPHIAQPYGDFAGRQRTANSKRSCADAIDEYLEELDTGLEFVSTPKNDYLWRIDCLSDLLKLRRSTRNRRWEPRFQISAAEHCDVLHNCMMNYVWDNTEKANPKPRLDKYSHGVTALEYLAINRFPVDETRTRKKRRPAVEFRRGFR